MCVGFSKKTGFPSHHPSLLTDEAGHGEFSGLQKQLPGNFVVVKSHEELSPPFPP